MELETKKFVEIGNDVISMIVGGHLAGKRIGVIPTKDNTTGQIVYMLSIELDEGFAPICPLLAPESIMKLSVVDNEGNVVADAKYKEVRITKDEIPGSLDVHEAPATVQ